MTISLISIMIGSLLVAIHIISVSNLIRWRNNIAPVAIHAFSATLLLAFLFTISLAVSELNFWIAFCVLSFGVSGYLFIFGAIYKSLSLRILLITKLNGGKSSVSELDVFTKASFAERATILCNMGLAIKENHGYRISQKGIHLAKKLKGVRKLFRINSSGLYQEDSTINKR